ETARRAFRLSNVRQWAVGRRGTRFLPFPCPRLVRSGTAPGESRIFSLPTHCCALKHRISHRETTGSSLVRFQHRPQRQCSIRWIAQWNANAYRFHDVCLTQTERFLEDRAMKLKVMTVAVAITLFLAASACSKQPDRTYKDSVKTALEQADLKDVTVSEDTDKNTITLGGTLHSEDAKQNAADVAKANAGSRIVVNEVSVQPVGQESEAKKVASNLDDGIENNFKAALVSKGLDKEH